MINDPQIAVIGLGYVGLPLLVELSNHYKVIGFDINENKVAQLTRAIDPTNEVGEHRLKQARVHFTTDQEQLKLCQVYIVTVPTPIHPDKTPNLMPIMTACQTIGTYLKKGDLVIFESTVYPGTTEEICVPILEKFSQLKLGRDFKVGYSPERINPGDRKNTLTNIVKIISASDDEALEDVDRIYSTIIKAGTFRVSSIKVAESAKVMENAQRDVNIAFMNELAVIFNQMGIDTLEVIEAASTKWNFLPFKPGLVGGHCIGVDPYYFIYKAEQLGYRSQIMASARRINDNMGTFVVKNVVKEMIRTEGQLFKKIGIVGFTYKENSSDPRNTRVIDIVNELKEYGFEILVYDPLADPNEVRESYGIELVNKEDLANLDTVIIAVPHDQIKQEFSLSDYKRILKAGRRLIFDLKAIYSKLELEKYGLISWRL